MRESLILVLSAMQLPVLACIGLLTFNSTILHNINQQSFRISGFLRGSVKKNNPLLFTSLGFLFNSIYGGLYILAFVGSAFSNNVGYRILPPENLPFSVFAAGENFLWMNLLIFSCNVLNTYCFLLQSVPQLFISDGKNEDADHKTTRGKIWRGWSIVVITLLTIPLWFTHGENRLLVSIYNFVGLSCISWYLFRLTSIREALIRNYTRYLFFTGWIIWTLLQTWQPLGSLLALPAEVIVLLGFSLSLVAKSLILYGFYVFSVRISRSAVTRLNHSNVDLNFANHRLAEKIAELNKTVDSINSLQGLIQSISNSRNLAELGRRVVEHLTSENGFGFDYAIFSEVNYITQRIVYKDSLVKNENIQSPQNWVKNEGVAFDHHDIMARVVKHRETVHTYGEALDGISIDINSEESPLNRDIYTTYNHQFLNRFFIPVIKLEDTGDGENRVVAIIEVGYYVKDIAPNSRGAKSGNKIVKRGELNLYLDSCAQTYERLFNQELGAKISVLLADCEGRSKDDHRLYIQEILKSICNFVQADLGFITLVSGNKTSQEIDFIFQEGQIDETEKVLIKNAFIDCLEEDVELDASFKINEEKFRFEIRGLHNTDSMLISGITIHEASSGNLFLFSKNRSYFNNVVRSIIRTVTENTGATYNEKKFHHSVAALVKPDNAITDLEENLRPLIEMLKDYFETPYISVWLKEFEVYPDRYIQTFASQELKSCSKNFGLNRITADNIDLKDDYAIIPIYSNDNELGETSPSEFERKNVIKTLLRKPLKTEHQIFGFINIYFNRSKDTVVYEDENLLNLISIKALTTIQIYGLVRAFREISDSFTQNDLSSTLQITTNSAMNLLNADPVILYRSADGNNIFCGDVYFANKADFKSDETIHWITSEKISHVELAEQILKHESVYFNNKTEFMNYPYRPSESAFRAEFKKDFWDRENIKSLAAVLLVHKTKTLVTPIGVMFFNFRNEVTFNQDLKRSIETFAALASGAIYNGVIFEQNREFLLKKLRLTKPILTEAIAAGALHDVSKISHVIFSFFDRLIEKLDSPYKKKMNPRDIRSELEKLKLPLTDLNKTLYELRALYSPDQNISIGNHSIKEILQRQIDTMQTEFYKKNIRVRLDFPDDEIKVDCDESQIGLALLNVLKNAYEAMNSRGELKIRLGRIDNSQIKIEIIDNGKGISEEIKPVMFEPYVSNKSGGSGLGLSMSKHIIEANHLGQISGKTKDGLTTLKIILPAELNINVNAEKEDKLP